MAFWQPMILEMFLSFRNTRLDDIIYHTQLHPQHTEAKTFQQQSLKCNRLFSVCLKFSKNVCVVSVVSSLRPIWNVNSFKFQISFQTQAKSRKLGTSDPRMGRTFVWLKLTWKDDLWQAEPT